MTQPGDPKSSGTGPTGDDFRKIDGVGRRFEQRLWDAGIFTYKDLARLTPEEVSAVLAPMARISPERIASQARELAGSPSEPSVPRQHYAAFHVEFLLESDNSVRRTKVHQHQTDARDAWSGWDEGRLLSFLRDRIPLPAATPADAPGVEQTEAQTGEPTQTETTDQEATSAEPAPAGQILAVPDWLPSWSVSIEELALIRDGQPSSTLSSTETSSVRLTMRINPSSTPICDTFDFSATIAARRFAGHDRSLLGTAHGTVRVGDVVSVEVAGDPALSADLYRLVATVDIYGADHAPEEPPLYQKRACGDLMRVVDVPLGSAPVMA